MKKKHTNPEIVVNTYIELVKKLKSYKIKPQEAFNLVYRNKYHLNARHYWTKIRIGIYLRIRIAEFAVINRRLRLKWKDTPSNFTRDNLKSKMPKKIKSCLKTVNTKLYKKAFHNYNPKVNWDMRKEAQNLHKLVTEKRKKDKFHSKLHRLIYEDFNRNNELYNRTITQGKLIWNDSVFQKLINIVR